MARTPSTVRPTATGSKGFVMMGAIVVGVGAVSGAMAEVGVASDGGDCGATEGAHAARTKAIDTRKETGLCMARVLARFGPPCSRHECEKSVKACASDGTPKD